MAKLTVETSRQVADFAEDPADGWEPAAAFRPSEREFRSALKGDLADARLSPAKSRQFQFDPKSVAFVEFDAANAGHAAAIYQCEFEGPAELVTAICDRGN